MFALWPTKAVNPNWQPGDVLTLTPNVAKMCYSYYSREAAHPAVTSVGT